MKNASLVVTGGFIEKDGKFILCQQAEYKGEDAFKWGPPTGKWDGDEDLIAGAIREVKEETGYDFTPTSILGIYSRVRVWPDATQNIVRILFRGELGGEKTEYAHDIIDTKWFTPEEIMAMDETTLRTLEIKKMMRDYLDGKSYPLELIDFAGKR